MAAGRVCARAGPQQSTPAMVEGLPEGLPPAGHAGGAVPGLGWGAETQGPMVPAPPGSPWSPRRRATWPSEMMAVMNSGTSRWCINRETLVSLKSLLIRVSWITSLERDSMNYRAALPAMDRQMDGWAPGGRAAVAGPPSCLHSVWQHLSPCHKVSSSHPAALPPGGTRAHARQREEAEPWHLRFCSRGGKKVDITQAGSIVTGLLFPSGFKIN